MEDQYVILTGSKNNAGDFLIKHRAKKLFSELRSDRKIIDIDAWKQFSDEELEIVNNSRALILMGGPALQFDMRPKVYELTQYLNDIKVPIISMGIGWKSREGEWRSSHTYKLNEPTLELLKRIDSSGYCSGVRDYHTLNILLKNKFSNFLMTGCPALYNTDFIRKAFDTNIPIINISYSLGVSFVESDSMETSMKENILGLSSFFKEKNFQVVFHHSLKKEVYQSSPEHDKFYKKHVEFQAWLNDNQINYKDISGSAEGLIEHYQKCDLHIGYRVHAHIFMCSESRLSVLLNEDGRGKALKYVISGLMFDAYELVKNELKLPNLNNKLYLKAINKIYLALLPSVKYQIEMKGHPFLTEDIIQNLSYEIENAFPRISATRKNIDLNYLQMKKFILQLP
ncbi:MAG: polysaccharide pyruvyl transferase family protein [Bacteroidetes bacterium]|nr:polysaccharide pyruvyl transferase family protein [Bacteroidota bacterium]HET6244698.1 polysaccharide pyruvyl transferase family protein [Bacteroidia bacterium]